MRRQGIMLLGVDFADFSKEPPSTWHEGELLGAGSEWVKGERDTLVRIIPGVLFGPVEVNTVKFNGVMPGHSHVSDEEIAMIASFVRFAFGDLNEKPVTPEEVKALRPEVEKRKFVPWTGDDLRGLG